jgi:hypothetical protein
MYHADQNLLFIRLLYKTVKIKIKTYIECSLVRAWNLVFGTRVYENKLLRKMCKPMRHEVTRGCKKLFTEELHSLNSTIRY